MKHEFRVWAPLPTSVNLKFGNQTIAMTDTGHGWRHAAVEGNVFETDYGFVLDDTGPFADPRSSWQPNGIHGLSRLVDHTCFQWTDQRWQPPPLSHAILYELHIGTFTAAGTFAAALEKLEHLVRLGVTHVELMPIAEFSGNHGWGYDGVNLFAPHHAYGSPDELKTFVNTCHERGLAVILDVVYNHLGPTGNHLPLFAPYFQNVQTPWGNAVNFDGPWSDEVRRFFCDNALSWLRDYHFDGLRLDAVHAIRDHSATPFLEQLKLEVERLESHLGKHFVVIAESDLNDPRLICSRDAGGFQLDGQWSDDFHHALHSVLTGEKKGYYEDFGLLSDLAKALENAFVYDGTFSIHRHRRHGRKPYGINGRKFLAYLQNHDQIGNRAKGERSSQLMSAGRLKIGAALLLLSPFVPMLFQGEEWGATTPFLYFTDHAEPELAKAVREGRRHEFAAFGWKPEEIPDPQAPETFQRSKLNWNELSQPQHANLLNWFREMIRLRRCEPALANGDLNRVGCVFDETHRWLCVQRGDIWIVCNLSSQSQRIPLEIRGSLLATSEPEIRHLENYVKLPSDSVAVFKIDDSAVE